MFDRRHHRGTPRRQAVGLPRRQRARFRCELQRLDEVPLLVKQRLVALHPLRSVARDDPRVPPLALGRLRRGSRRRRLRALDPGGRSTPASCDTRCISTTSPPDRHQRQVPRPSFRVDDVRAERMPLGCAAARTDLSRAALADPRQQPGPRIRLGTLAALVGPAAAPHTTQSPSSPSPSGSQWNSPSQARRPAGTGSLLRASITPANVAIRIRQPVPGPASAPHAAHLGDCLLVIETILSEQTDNGWIPQPSVGDFAAHHRRRWTTAPRSWFKSLSSSSRSLAHDGRTAASSRLVHRGLGTQSPFWATRRRGASSIWSLAYATESSLR